MTFRESFVLPKYDDAPHLSDQLLLPNLAQGHNVYLFSAFAPSYLFRLISDLAASPEVEPGFLNIVFFVPGDLTLKSAGVARFRNYLLRYSTHEGEVADFVNNVLQLVEESATTNIGGLRISILHTTQKRPLAKGCVGVISSSENPDDYVAFSDSKGGDFNSPVQPLRSWMDPEYFRAESVLRQVIEASNGNHPRGVLVTDSEALDWFTYLSNYYLDNPPSLKQIDSAIQPLPNLDEHEGGASLSSVYAGKQASPSSEVGNREPDELAEDDDEFLSYLQELDDFPDEEQIGWSEGNDSLDAVDNLGDFAVVVDRAEAVEGHIPPLPSSIADLVGPATAQCPCGVNFVRAQGCPEVSWN